MPWKDRETARLYALEYNHKHKIKINNMNRANHARKRAEVIKVVGDSKCKECGINEYRVLELDHKKGDGYLDSKRFQSTILMIHYYYNHLLEAKRIFQVLCANCHRIKTYKNGEHLNIPYRNAI